MKLSIVFVGGAVFGTGLALSTMTHQEVVLSFLQLHDLGLMLVMGGGIAVTALAFLLAPRMTSRPPAGERFEPLRDVLDRDTLLGACLFGLGWGVSGLCPGSAIASLGSGNLPVLIGLAGMWIGAHLQGRSR